MGFGETPGLAMEVLHREAPTSRVRPRSVDLGALRESALVVPKIIAALGLPEPDDCDPLDSLVAPLLGLRVLLSFCAASGRDIEELHQRFPSCIWPPKSPAFHAPRDRRPRGVPVMRRVHRRSTLPSARPSGMGTALPICRAMWVLVPTHR